MDLRDRPNTGCFRARFAPASDCRRVRAFVGADIVAPEPQPADDAVLKYTSRGRWQPSRSERQKHPLPLDRSRLHRVGTGSIADK